MRSPKHPLVLVLAVALGLSICATQASASDSPPKDGDKHVSGMSIVGNDEAPKSLVIVPWKSSDMGDSLDISKTLDDGRRPVDVEVFRRALDYYEIRSGTGR